MRGIQIEQGLERQEHWNGKRRAAILAANSSPVSKTTMSEVLAAVLGQAREQRNHKPVRLYKISLVKGLRKWADSKDMDWEAFKRRTQAVRIRSPSPENLDTVL
jgi:hypothetical protein